MRLFINRYAIIALLLHFAIVGAYAHLKGIILDEQGKPLTGVSVVIYKQDDKILAFATSGSDGHYSFEKDLGDEAKYLVARLIGYKTDKVTITNPDETINLTLYRDDITLKEVIIKAAPIRQENDTTQYMVSAFSDGHEKNVEELLMKLPGIDVSESGKISFRGKPISKILLDHTDMFGENYKTASKTIPSHFVSTIEAISHYQENRHLRDVQSSDEVVLNLSLRSDLKLQRPVGQVNLGGGITDRYDLGGNLLTMNKKFKLYDAAALSNVTSSDLLPSYEQDAFSPLEIVSDYTHSFADRDNIKYAKVQSQSNSLNMVYQPTSKLTLKDHFIAQGNRFTTGSHEVIRYIDDLSTIEHYNNLKNKPWVINNNVEAKYDWNKSTTLIFKNAFVYNNKHVDNQFIDSMTSNYTTRTKDVSVENRINLSHSFPNKSALIIDAINVFSNGSQTFNYSKHINQFVDVERGRTTAVAHYLKRNMGWEWNVKAGYEGYYDKLNSTNDMMANQFANFHEHLLYIHPDMTWTKGKWKIQFGTLLGYWHQHINTIGNGEASVSKLKVMPDATIEFDWKKHHFSLSSTYEPQRMEPMDYLTLYTDHRQIMQASNMYNHRMADIGMTSSYMFTPSLGTMLMAMYMFTKSNNNYIYHYEISQDMEMAIPTALGDSKRHLGILSFTHYSDALRHGLRLSANYSSLDYENMVGSLTPHAVNSSSFTSKLSVKSSFSSPVNYMVGGRYGLSSYHREGSGKFTAYNYSFFQELDAKAGNLKAKLSFDEHLLGKSHKFYLFISPNIKYEWKRYNVSLSLSAYNILNHGNINEYLLTDIYSREYEQQIAPAYYLISVSFRY